MQSFTNFEMADDETPSSAASSSRCQPPFMYKMTAAILSCCESFEYLATEGIWRVVVETRACEVWLPYREISLIRYIGSDLHMKL